MENVLIVIVIVLQVITLGLMGFALAHVNRKKREMEAFLTPALDGVERLRKAVDELPKTIRDLLGGNLVKGFFGADKQPTEGQPEKSIPSKVISAASDPEVRNSVIGGIKIFGDMLKAPKESDESKPKQ